MFKIGSKVKILAGVKADGRCNYGRVVGVVMEQNGNYLGYRDEKEFLSRFTVPTYTVAYIDCVTERACVGEFSEKELSK